MARGYTRRPIAHVRRPPADPRSTTLLCVLLQLNTACHRRQRTPSLCATLDRSAPPRPRSPQRCLRFRQNSIRGGRRASACRFPSTHTRWKHLRRPWSRCSHSRRCPWRRRLSKMAVSLPGLQRSDRMSRREPWFRRTAQTTNVYTPPLLRIFISTRSPVPQQRRRIAGRARPVCAITNLHHLLCPRTSTSCRPRCLWLCSPPVRAPTTPLYGCRLRLHCPRSPRWRGSAHTPVRPTSSSDPSRRKRSSSSCMMEPSLRRRSRTRDRQACNFILRLSKTHLRASTGLGAGVVNALTDSTRHIVILFVHPRRTVFFSPLLLHAPWHRTI